MSSSPRSCIRLVLGSLLLAGIPAVAADAPRPDAGSRLTYAELEGLLFSEAASSVVIAQVRDEKVTLRDIAAALGSTHGATVKETKVGKIELGAVIDRAIEVRLIALEARDMGMDTVPEFKKAVDEFKLEAGRELLRQQATATAVADPAEVDRLYKDITREWKVRSALVTQKADADRLVAAVKAGKSFEAQVKRLVEEKKARGGEEAQYLPRARLHAPVEAALQKLKKNQISAPIAVPGGFAVVKYEDIRYPDNANARMDAEAASLSRKKREALENYYAALIKRYVKVDTKLVESLELEAPDAGVAPFRADTRAVAQIDGAPPVTVADLVKVLEENFFHGVDRAAREKKLNREKVPALDTILAKRVVPLEVARERINERPYFKQLVADYVTRTLFSRFLELVVVPSLKLDEAAERKYYEQHKKEYMFPAFYTVESLAFLDVKAAQAALGKLQAKTDFKWLNANAEGQVKPADRKLDINGTLSGRGVPKELAALLENAKKDDFRLFAGPESQYYVIHVVDVTPSRAQPFEDARADVKEKLFPEQLTASVKDWSAKLRKAHPVKLYVEKGR